MSARAPKKSWVAVANTGKEMIYVIRLIHKENKEELYCVIAVDGPKEKEFLDALESNGKISFQDFGKVLASDYGEPSDEVKRWLRDSYNATI